ncbi:PXK [Mytilus edulis]|uniref:PXK n=1 Tax=Mytilus edulis TaxID=6550 RepID=A0A8S3SMC0_MYTED|nr:PXK [Mytilus edulis]
MQISFTVKDANGKEDIIAATIQPDTPISDVTTQPEPTTTAEATTTSEDDDEALAAAILEEATALEPETETRLADSLFDLLGSPPPEQLLTNNSAVLELQSLLKTELKQQTIPQTLMSLLHKPKTSVFTREQQLQRQFTKLEVSNRCLSYPASSSTSLLSSRQSVSVSNLQQTVSNQIPTTTTKMSTTRPSTVRSRPQLSRRSVQLMEEWYHCNVDHPYPDSTTIQSALQGNIREEQVKKWFANKRNRSQNTRTAITSHITLPLMDKPILKIPSKLKEFIRTAKDDVEKRLHDEQKVYHPLLLLHQNHQRAPDLAPPAAPPAPPLPHPPGAPPPPPPPPGAPAPPPPPPPTSGPAAPPPPASNERGALLGSIQNFSKGGLKKAVTVDKSAPKV